MLYLGVMLFFGKGELSITKVSNLPSKKQMFINGLIVRRLKPKGVDIFLSFTAYIFWIKTTLLASLACALSQ